MSEAAPRYSGAAALLSLRFHQLAPRHVRHWGGDPTIMDAYVGPFHGKGQALYLNLGRRQRKTLTNGFTAVVDRPVERDTLQACQWKGKHFMRQRLKWRKPGERLQGRECALRVKCGDRQVGVKSVQMGMAYGFRGGVFEKFYVDRHTVVEYVDEYGIVHQVPIRRGRDTSELMGDCVKIRAIHVQAKRVSEYATSRQASESEREERLSSDDSCSSLPFSSSLSDESESAESGVWLSRGSSLEMLTTTTQADRRSSTEVEAKTTAQAGTWGGWRDLFVDAGWETLEAGASGDEDGFWEDSEGWEVLEWDEDAWDVDAEAGLGDNKKHNKIAFDLKKLTGRMENKKQIRIIFKKLGSRSYKRMMDVLAVMKKYMLAKNKRDIIFGAKAMMSLREGKAGVVKKKKATDLAG